MFSSCTLIPFSVFIFVLILLRDWCRCHLLMAASTETSGRVALVLRHLTAASSQTTQQDRPSVCLIIGCGRGIGRSVARRFVADGFSVACVRRSDGLHLDELVDELNATIASSDDRRQNEARGFLLDATNEASISSLVESVEADLGPIGVLIWNVGANVGPRSLLATTPKVFERAWRLGALGAFQAARAVVPHMLRRQQGTIILTGATAGMRGQKGACVCVCVPFCFSAGFV
jgi:NAD(P)-dependent dehydrogenase (short-subunit alcohol dehydrogenase family)